MAQEQNKQEYLVTNKLRLIREEDWSRTNLLFFFLGIEIPLIGGFWIWNSYPLGSALFLFIPFLAVPLGAMLLRSWWALLIVPVVFTLGAALGLMLPPLLQGGWSTLQERLESGLEGLDILLIIGTPAILVLAALGTAFGVSLGKKWVQCRRKGNVGDLRAESR